MQTHQSRMTHQGRAARGGFTLIELLVVVAIIALLISILLPSLSGAKEQAKLAKCLSNLKNVGIAQHQYFLEFNDWFPFEKRNGLSPNPFHGFYYGGHPGRNIDNDQVWWGYIIPRYRDTPAGRPFNQYLYPDMPDWDVLPKDPSNPNDPNDAPYVKVREMPLFSCPSDTGGFWQTEPGDLPSGWRPLYYETGNSYDENYHFALSWAYSFPDPNNPNARKYWMQRANAYIKTQLQHWSAIFIIAYEDPFDSSMWNRIPRRGWHKKWNRHSFLFLDSHAANVTTKVTEAPYTWGPSWKSASGNSAGAAYAWWRKGDGGDPNPDPDYQYRYISLLPGT